jgi:hypothetical protein
MNTLPKKRWNSRKIITAHTFWCATFDGYEPGDPIGRGRTKEAAVVDLLEQAEEAEETTP